MLYNSTFHTKPIEAYRSTKLLDCLNTIRDWTAEK